MVVQLVDNSSGRNSSCQKLTDEQIYGRVRRAVQKVERRLPSTHPIAGVDESELSIGEELGKGAYCSVREASWNGKSLAMKKLRSKTHESRVRFMAGTRDLGTEAAILAGLDHPNIVKLHGVASGSVQERIAAGEERGFFLLMDKVSETLEQRVNRWKKQEDGEAGLQAGPTRLFAFQQVSQQSWATFIQQRLPVALGIAQALQYLQENGVMYRDLKPDNIGIDENGRVKMIDFGFATTEPMSCECVGNRAFMAPEVVLRRPYSQSVDVYSFGILLWHLCALKRPFEGYSREGHLRAVVWDGKRPNVPSWYPRPMQRLLESCWCPCPTERASMGDVVKALEQMMSSSLPASSTKSKQVAPATVSVCA